MRKLVVAIDGPSGSGKSTIAKILASKYNIIHVDSGAMYRAIAFVFQEHASDIQYIKMHLDDIVIGYDERGVLLNGQPCGPELRSGMISELASKFAQYPEVRKKVDAMIHEVARQKSCVVDGRDIGSHVLPDADVKFFFVASVEQRAKRRIGQLRRKYKIHPPSLETMMREIEERDLRDATREVHPTIQTEDAIVIHTGKLTVQQTIKKVMKVIRQKSREA